MATLDFELGIGPGAVGGYPVVARAPGGEVVSTLRWSVTPAELDRQLAVIKDKVLVSSAMVRRALTGPGQSVRELGQWLFEEVIADEVRALYVASRQQARENGDVLRLVLRVHPPELARLPWEFLFDPSRQDYLGLTMPLVRYLQVLAPRQPLRVVAPLRVLGMIVRPGDQDELDGEQERQRLQDALAGPAREGLVELGWVAGQTYSDLEDALDDGPWHVFHFVGHGGYDGADEEGTLALADDTGRTYRIGADDISRLLAEHYPLRLVVLNACETGRSGSSDSFSGIAAALIRREIPAVVAMQFEITDWAAIRFSHAFYQHVARRRPVDECVMRARRALRLARKDTLEWGTPVLYLRAPDGRVFDTTTPQSTPSRDPVPAAAGTATSLSSAPRPLPGLPAPPAASRVVRNPDEVLTLWHDLAVNAVTFSPDGHRLATASDDRTAGVWDTASGRQLTAVTHDGVVWGVAFSPDGRLLATASIDWTARVRDAVSGQPLVTVTHHGWVRGVAFSPDGRLLATASDDETARIWDVTTGRQLVSVTHHGSVKGVVFSPDGHRVATAGADNTARVWDVASGRRLAVLTHQDWVLGVAFSPDGRLLATASTDRTMRIWEATSGDRLADVTHDSVVRGVAFSPDGRRLATASEDMTARIWMLNGNEDLDESPDTR